MLSERSATKRVHFSAPERPFRSRPGDVAFDEAEPIVDAITPVPGGVGGVTTSILVEHVVNAALLKMKASEK